MDTDFFTNVNVLEFINNNRDTICIISEKNTLNSIDSTIFTPLNFENNYCIDFKEVDSSIKAIVPRQIDRGDGAEIIVNDKPFWKNDYIIARVYTSEDIKGIYIRKDKIKID